MARLDEDERLRAEDRNRVATDDRTRVRSRGEQQTVARITKEYERAVAEQNLAVQKYLDLSTTPGDLPEYFRQNQDANEALLEARPFANEPSFTPDDYQDEHDARLLFDVEKAVAEGDGVNIPQSFWMGLESEDIRMLGAFIELDPEGVEQIVETALDAAWWKEENARLASEVYKRYKGSESSKKWKAFWSGLWEDVDLGGAIVDHFKEGKAAPPDFDWEAEMDEVMRESGYVTDPEPTGEQLRFVRAEAEGRLAKMIKEGKFAPVELFSIGGFVKLDMDDVRQSSGFGDYPEDEYPTLASIENDVRMDMGLIRTDWETYDDRSAMHQTVVGVLGVAGSGIEWGVHGLGSALAAGERELNIDWTMGTRPGFTVTEYVQRREDDILAEALARVEAEQLVTDEELLRQVVRFSARASLPDFQASEPEAWNTYVDAAGGDEIMAAGFYTFELGQAVTAEDQVVKDFLTDVRADQEEALEALEDFNFSVGDQFLSWLATYGKNIPMRLATTAMLLITDDQVQQAGWMQKWSTAQRIGAEYDWSPAAVLGIDGTLSGLMLDLGGGIAFDPFTYFFMGRAALMSALPKTAAHAARVAKSGVMSKKVKAIVEAANAVDGGVGALRHLMHFLDDVSVMDILEISGYANQKLPFARWRKAKLGQHAGRMNREIIDEILPGLDELLDLKGVTVEDIIKMEDSLLINGFEDAIEITLSRGDGLLTVTDGAVRLKAAQNMALKNMPVRIRIADDVASGLVKIPGLSLEVSTRMAKIATDGLRHTKGMINDAEAIDTLITLQSRSAIAAHKANGTIMGTHIDDAGRTFTIYRLTSELETGGRMSKYWMLADDSDELVSVLWYNKMDFADGTPNTITTATKAGKQYERQGHQTKLWDAAGEFEDLHPIMLAGNSETTSKAAADFAQSYARRKMTEAAPTNAEGRVGVHIDDILEEGEELGINLAEVGKGQQGVLGESNEVFLRPAKVLPDRLVRGVIDDQAIIEIVQNAIIKRGVTPTGATFGAQQRWWNGNMREKMRETGVGRWLEDQVGQYGTTRNHNLSGPQAVNDAIEAIWRIAGEGMGLYDDLIQKLTDAQILGGRSRFNNAKVTAALRAPLARIREIDNLIGSATDDILKRADDLGAPSLGEDIALHPGFKQKTGEGFASEAERLREAEIFAARQQMSKAERARSDRATADADASTPRADLLAERLALEKQVSPIMRQLEDRIAQQQGLSHVIQEVLEEAWERFNREMIASQKGWAWAVGEDGLVPWEILRKGRALTDDEAKLALQQEKTILTKTLRDEMKLSGILDPESRMRAVTGLLDEPVTWQAPISELELLAATSWSGRQYAHALQAIWVGQAREGLLVLQKWWVYDKVGRPATAAVVSFDELLRIFETAGLQKGFIRWAQDRAIFMQARIQSGRGPINMWRRGSVQAGSKHLSVRSQARLQGLSNKERLSIQAERQMVDEVGLGWVDVLPKDPGYLDAARRFTGQFLQRQEFRAFLRGRDAFYQFFDSEQGLQMQKAAALQKRSATGTQAVVNVTAEQMYQGWEAFYAAMLKGAEKKGMLAEIDEAWRLTARQIDEGAGQQLLNLPDKVFESLGPVRGMKNTKANPKNPLAYGMERYFNTIFEGPINYRRGFVAELTREAERARLYQLYAEAGYKVMTNVEAETKLGLQGMSNAMGGGAKQFVEQAALDSGIILKSFMDDLVERQVQRTTADLLYNFQAGSKLGARARAVFPFAKPWADMWAYWARNVLRKPVVRGWVQNSRIPGLRKTLESLPINPKPAAMISRLAATDFEIDQDIFGMHVQADFSPLFFLPTGGTQPFGVIIPGLGWLPMHLLDQMAYVVKDPDSPLGFRSLDPIDDATEYTNRTQMISEFVPGLGYQVGAGVLEAAAGGGVIKSAYTITNSVLSWQKGDTMFDAIDWLQDPQTALEVNQQVVDIIAADPDFFTNLFNLDTYDKARDEVYGVSEEAFKNVHGANAIEATTRFLFPMTTRIDIGQAVSHELWFQAVDQFPTILDPTGKINTVDLRDPKAVAAFATYARGNFFDLTQEDQDLLIFQNNHLAVNTVGSWEWTDEADEQNIVGVEDGYRTPANLDLHRSYKDQGIIRPVTPNVYVNRIIGRVERATVRSYQRLYTLAAESVNEWRWENVVSDRIKRNLNDVLNGDGQLSEFAREYGYHTVRELWEGWDEVEERYEKWLAQEQGIKLDSKEFQDLKDAVSIPGKQQAWGTKWKDLDEEEQSARFKGIHFDTSDFTPEMQAQADALGIELIDGMTGLEIFKELQQGIASMTHPAWAQGATAYTTWQEGRNNVRDGTRDPISRAIQLDLLDQEWRTDLENFMTRTQNNLEFLYDTVGDVPMADAQRVVDEFENLRIRDGGNSGIDWDGTWKRLFERTYGPRNWEPPLPAEPKPNILSNTMNLISNTTTPYDVRVVDGDTLNFKFGQGDSQRHKVRLLGVNSAEYGFTHEQAEEDTNRLRDFIYEAVLNGDTLYLVRDPSLFGNTDNFGRMLAWLWAGDTPFYFPDEMIRSITPSEGDR